MILPPTTRRAVFWCIATLLLAITCVLHFWKIGFLPSGLQGDECSIAYNAYCITETGADEYGTRYPMFFRGFDVYYDPVMVYCLVPLMKIFGLQEWAARLPSAVFHILASVMFALLAQEYCRNRWIALASGFVFSVVPWTFPVSRAIAGGYTPMLFGMVAGWLWLLRAFGKRSHGYAVAAGVAWAFAMYAHNIGRPMTALLLVCYLLAYNRLLLSRWKIGATFFASYVATLLPMIVWVLRTPQSLTTRFETLSIFQDHPSILVFLQRFGSRFVEYFTPQFLLLHGDPNLRHNIGFGGELFWFLGPLIPIGLFVVIRFFRWQPHYRFLTIGTLVYPTAASLTEDHMHSMRSLNGVIFWILLAAIGTRLLWQKRAAWRDLLLVLMCVGNIEIALYMRAYFGPEYQSSCRDFFQGQLADALKYCFQHLSHDEILYVSDSTFSPHGSIVNAELKPFLYAYVLFYGKIDSRKYQQTGFPMDTVQLYENYAPKPGLLLRCNFRLLSITDPQWASNDEPLPSGSHLLARFPFPNPDLQFEVFKIP
jgi:4-amino-4-deoxy-L-arabinose transferase-like glycosyltransferase